MSTATGVLADGSATGGVRRGKFSVAMSWILLFIVLLGFSPTFFARPLFGSATMPPLTPYLYVHGVLMTCLYGLFVVQASLIRTANTALHRKLGILGVALAILVVPFGIWLALMFPARMLAVFNAPPEVLLPRFTEGVAVSLAVTLLAGIFLASAFLNTKKPQRHWRFILLAFIAMTAPALTRIGGLPVFGGINFHIPMCVGSALLVATLWTHDFGTRRAIHPIYSVGGSALVAILVLAYLVVPRMTFFQEFVRSLI